MTGTLVAGAGAGAGPGVATYTAMVLDGLARAPERVAIRHGEAAVTAGECLEAVYRLARALASAGLGPGDGVTLLAGNTPEALLVRPAANLIGCRVAVLHADRPVAERIALARDARTAALVFDPARGTDDPAGGTDATRRISAALPGALALALGPSAFGTDLLELAAPLSSAPLAPAYRPDDVMAVRFTAGSTGRPKGVQRRFARPPRPELIAASTFLLCTALGHGGGTTADLALAAGGTVVLQDGFSAGAVLEAIERYRVSRVYLPPHLLYQVLDHPALSGTDTGSLRRVTYTGCAAAPERLAEATRRLGRVMHQTYSLTEAGPVTRLTPDEHLDPRLLRTAGRPLPDTEVRIVDEEGAPLPVGALGEICVRTPTAMTGYWRDPELTARVLRDGWLHTGDLGRLDRSGYLTVAGRRDAMAIVDAHNIYPQDVEEPLLAHPAVREAVMFATTGRDRLERVHAAVTTVPGAPVTEQQLHRWMQERGGPRCDPATILVLPVLPLAETGKPDLAALRALLPETRPGTGAGAGAGAGEVTGTGTG
ncbi:AMP-binding protein [Kitasatospora sp. A2-31]|uniref:AMP-binding protein n=1 Tax=Kitasatospora sp. A2-31 TaxID=2916414 RepID=UPI001EEADBA5|nr:AMP-binding protein [Kitasatospora sp. A2-31]MCG6493974.1 AMP-binding protein [Kitasatospora sp. A2-31]